jgi:hypothetical protein
MDRNEPQIVVEGIEDVIKRDLQKHKGILERTKIELIAYRSARSHEVQKKKHYKSLIGGGKFNDTALKKSMGDISINIRHFSDKIKLTEDAITHHSLIVDTLTKQLEDQNKGLEALAKYRREHPDGNIN